MGSTSRSTERHLAVPLHAQSPPVLATSLGTVAPQFTTLCVQRRSFWGRDHDVFDVATQTHVFDFRYKSFRARGMLQTPDGRAIVAITNRNLSYNYRVYEGDETEHMSFEIHVHWSGGHFVHVAFRDFLSGRPCCIVLHGNSKDHVALFYIAYDELSFVATPTREDVVSSGRFQPIGRTRSAPSQSFYQDPYFVEAAPGVDLTLLLLLWRAWKETGETEES